MTRNADTAMPTLLLLGAGSDPIEDRLRATVRATIEALFDAELAAFLGRIRYSRGRGRGVRKHSFDGWSDSDAGIDAGTKQPELFIMRTDIDGDLWQNVAGERSQENVAKPARRGAGLLLSS